MIYFLLGLGKTNIYNKPNIELNQMISQSISLKSFESTHTYSISLVYINGAYPLKLSNEQRKKE